MTIFSSKVSVQVPTQSLWDYVLGAEDQIRSQVPGIFDVEDPNELHLSAGDVAMHARRFAETLTAAGVRSDDRILFVYLASIYSAPFFLATYLVGAIFIPLSADITPSELQVIFEH
jgi:acyl-coenzyme A synthetase/AMP-(fatty) acid ligase